MKTIKPGLVLKATPRIYTLHEDGEESSFDVSDEDTYEDEIQGDVEMPVLDDSSDEEEDESENAL